MHRFFLLSELKQNLLKMTRIKIHPFFWGCPQEQKGASNLHRITAENIPMSQKFPPNFSPHIQDFSFNLVRQLFATAISTTQQELYTFLHWSLSCIADLTRLWPNNSAKKAPQQVAQRVVLTFPLPSNNSLELNTLPDNQPESWVDWAEPGRWSFPSLPDTRRIGALQVFCQVWITNVFQEIRSFFSSGMKHENRTVVLKCSDKPKHQMCALQLCWIRFSTILCALSSSIGPVTKSQSQSQVARDLDQQSLRSAPIDRRYWKSLTQNLPPATGTIGMLQKIWNHDLQAKSRKLVRDKTWC